RPSGSGWRGLAQRRRGAESAAIKSCPIFEGRLNHSPYVGCAKSTRYASNSGTAFGRSDWNRTLMMKLPVLLLTFVMLLAATSTNADVEGDFEYQANEDGTVAVTRYLGSEEEVVIP